MMLGKRMQSFGYLIQILGRPVPSPIQKEAEAAAQRFLANQVGKRNEASCGRAPATLADAKRQTV